MGDPSATAALDAYLARQTSFSSSSANQDGKGGISTRPRRTASENASAIKMKGVSVLRANMTRPPLQDSSQHARRHSSLGHMLDSHGGPIDRLTDHASLLKARKLHSGRMKAVWPPLPLDETDETPLLEKLHPATPRGAGATATARKSSLQALRKLKRVSSTKGQSAGPQQRPPGQGSPSLPPAEKMQPTKQPVLALWRSEHPTHATHGSQPINAASGTPQQDATSAVLPPFATTAAAQQLDAAQAGKASAQGSTAGAAPEAPRASRQAAAAPDNWRRARWDASLDAEDTRALDSLIPRQPSTQPDPHFPAAGHNAAGGHLPQTSRVPPGQPSAPSAAPPQLPRGISTQATMSTAPAQGRSDQDKDVDGAVSAASVLAEVLAELRAEESSHDAASNEETASGRAGADLTKAALEEASALDAVVSWYRDVQRQQIDEGLSGDPVMFPLGKGIKKDVLGGQNSALSGGGGAAASVSGRSGNGGGLISRVLEGTNRPSVPTSGPEHKADPLLHLPEMPPPIRSNARLAADIQPQKADSDGGQKQGDGQGMSEGPSSPVDTVPRLRPDPWHVQIPSEEGIAPTSDAQSPAKEPKEALAAVIASKEVGEPKAWSSSKSPKEPAGNSNPLRDLAELREKWRTFCDGAPSQSLPPPAPLQPAAVKPATAQHAASADVKSSAEPDLAWEGDSDWLLAGCVGAEEAESCAAESACAPTDQPCDCSVEFGGAESLGSLADWELPGGRPSGSVDCFSRAQQSCKLPRCHASSARAGSQGWDSVSCLLDELSEADYLSPFRLSQELQPASGGCSQSEAGDLFNALDAELNWEEVIEEFMQPAVADEMSIIEQFMQPSGGESASRPDRDMYQYYIQRGEDARRSAVSAT